VIHLAALHQYGSNNPLGTNSTVDKVGLYPYFYVKDLVAWVAFALFFSDFPPFLSEDFDASFFFTFFSFVDF
jgi:ubiquinol-cytochrome c reductase cytochrome b subunit